jgi:hypothetical protein
MPKNSVVKYETALKSDKFLLIAHGAADEVAKAKSILETSGASEIAAHPGYWQLNLPVVRVTGVAFGNLSIWGHEKIVPSCEPHCFFRIRGHEETTN